MFDNNEDIVNQLMEVAIERMKTAAHPGLTEQDVEDAELELRGFVSDVQSGMIPKELIPSRIDRLTKRVFKSGVDSIENHIGYLRMAIDMAKPGFHRELEKNLPMDHAALDAKLMEVYIDPDIEKYATFGFKRSFYEPGMNGLDKDIRVLDQVDTVPSQNIKVTRLKREKTFKNPESEDVDNHYFVSHDADGTIHHVMKFNQENTPNDSTVREILVSKNPNSSIPTSEFYGHLLNNGIGILSDDTHSPGAKKLWDHLQGLGYPHQVLNAADNSVAYGIKNPYQKIFPSTKDTKKTKYLRMLMKPVYPDFLASGSVGTNNPAREQAPDTSGAAVVTEELLNEAFLTRTIGKNETFGHDIFFGHNGIHDAREYLQHFHKEQDLGKLNKHLNVSHFKSTDNRGGYFMTHDANGIVHHVAQYENPYKNNPNTISVNALSKNLKAHHISDAADLYAHLIHHGHVIQGDTSHTIGGLETWRKLSRKPGVSVHAWDLQKDRPINTDRNLRNIDDTHVNSTQYNDAKNEGGLEAKDKEHIGFHVALIAHQK